MAILAEGKAPAPPAPECATMCARKRTSFVGIKSEDRYMGIIGKPAPQGRHSLPLTFYGKGFFCKARTD